VSADPQRTDVGAFALLAVGVLSVGAAAILVRLAGAPALTASFVRLAVGGATLAALALVLKRPWPRGAGLRRAAVAGALLALHFGLWIASLSLTSVTASVVLVCLQPAFVIVGAAVFLRERTRLAVVVAIAVAFVGAVIIAVDDTGGTGATLVGNGLALGGAVAIAAYVLVLRELREDVLSSSAVITLTAALCTAPVAVAVGAPLVPDDARALGWLLALALGPQVIGHTALNAALRRLPAAVVSGSILGEPVIASALAIVVLDERVGVLTVVGSVVTLVGVMLLGWAARRR